MKKIILFLSLLGLVALISPVYSQEFSTSDLYAAHDTLTQFWLSNLQSSQSETLTEQSSELSIFITFVNPYTNELVVGIGYDTSQSIEDIQIQIEEIVGADVPISVKRGYFIEETCNSLFEICDPQWVRIPF